MTEAHKARNRRAYQKKVDEHRCVHCGKPDERTLRGLRYCQKCMDKRRAKPRAPRTPKQRAQENADKRAWYKMCIDKHICVQCRRKDKHTVDGHAFCAICQGKKNKKQREKWNSSEQAAYCKNRRDRRREQGLCTYCGREKEEPDKMLCIDCRVKAKLKRLRKKAAKGGAKDFGKGKYS